VSLPNLANRPLSTQARDALLAAIRRGDFPDKKLPPEETLATSLGVSRTTVRAALQQLEHDGILSRRRGIGTRIVPASETRVQLELGRLVSLDDLLREHGHESTTDILSVRRKRLPSLSREIGLDESSEWHVIEKLWRADGHPAALLVDHIPLAWIPVLPPQRRLLETIFRLFAEAGPGPIAHARAELVPMLAEPDVAEQLHLERGRPHLRVWQRHYGLSGEQLATSRLDVNDQLIRFELLRKV
jgi:GntR family transcriptional regulator